MYLRHKPAIGIILTHTPQTSQKQFDNVVHLNLLVYLGCYNLLELGFYGALFCRRKKSHTYYVSTKQEEIKKKSMKILF